MYENYEIIQIGDRRFGESIVYDPLIPINAGKYEDKTIPRICCCPTIMGCIIASQMTLKVAYEQNDILNKQWGNVRVYLYSADVDIDDIYQPTESELYDVFYTGELWILNKSYTFTRMGEYGLRRHMNIPFSPYSRYAMTKIGEDEVADCKLGDPLYGNTNSFSFIDFNPERVNECESFYNKYPDAYYCDIIIEKILDKI